MPSPAQGSNSSAHHEENQNDVQVGPLPWAAGMPLQAELSGGEISVQNAPLRLLSLEVLGERLC